jgi:protease IV
MPMKKSRTGRAILFIVLVVGAFLVLSLTAARLFGKEDDGAGWKDWLGQGDKIGVIRLEGVMASSDETLKRLRKFRKSSSIKAIVIRINSPGGTVAPAQEIYREILRTKRKKPVVVSMETVAASAAYYVSSASNRIVCSKGTITGSIGVIMMMADIHSIIEKIGVNVNVIKAGKYKDIGSGVRPLTEEERNILEGFAREIHEQFIADVLAGRKGKIDEAKLRTIADGRFFSGEKAKEFGLVDTIGNFYDAVKIAAELGGIKTEPTLVYPEKKWENYLELLTESAAQSAVKAMDRLKVFQRTPLAQ